MLLVAILGTEVKCVLRGSIAELYSPTLVIRGEVKLKLKIDCSTLISSDLVLIF